MLSDQNERLLARIIAVGSGFTTIFVISGAVTDPVNVTKFLSLGITASVILGILGLSGFFGIVKSRLIAWISAGFFLTSALLSVFASSSPLSQNIYGAYGRNNGFLTYFFLAIMFVAAASLKSLSSLDLIIKWLLVAGIVNVAYCLWVIVFGDFIGWSNPYGNILGTLGNPNFIGSFLGIFIAAYLGYSLGKNSPKWFKYSAVVVIPITAFEIVDSNAIQGRVVGLAGFAIVGFFFFRSKTNRLVTGLYTGGVSILGTFAVLGALQIGPLTSLVYKTSVSLRGQYWLAGWNTGEGHPITGVGMDSFGDWYRRERDLRAIELPGVNTVVNAAHNVPLDMFAFGGWPLFLSYLAILCVGGWSLIKSIVRVKRYEPVLVVLTTSWLGYQVQSLISINQIGLAIWGWVLTGCLIAYERIARFDGIEPKTEPKLIARKSRAQEGYEPRIVLSGTLFGLTGLLLALPPIASDSKWRAAQVSGQVEKIVSSMQTSYMNPVNSTKYLTTIQLFEQNQFFDLAHKYSLEAVSWNSESFELWKVLYLIKNSTPEEKSLALLNMKRLDPLNKDVTSVS